jgi:hypothetical protein
VEVSLPPATARDKTGEKEDDPVPEGDHRRG